MLKSRMQKAMPQEVEVWYVIPAVRRELAKIFIRDHNMSQKKAAEILGVTEAAISQYLNAKRASEINFTHQEINLIKKAAESIKKDAKNVLKHMYKLVTCMRGSKTICRMHRKLDNCVPNKCDICSSR